MSSLFRALALLIGVGCIGAGAFLFMQPRVEQYVTGTRQCQRCHTEEAKRLGEHADSNCQACHTMPKDRTVALLWGAVSSDAAMPKHGALDQRACKSCHMQDIAAWNALARTPGHASHALEPALVECSACHGLSLHGKPASSERCEACHAKTIAKQKAGLKLDCLRCHVFASGNPGAATGSLKVNVPSWGSEITGKNVHGAADCRLCHNPHREEGQADKALKVECTSCHRGDLARSVTHAPNNHTVCTTCHRPHGLRAELATACAVCHQKPRVHGKERDPGVPPEMRTLTTIAPILAARVGPPKPPPDITHEGKCANCHEPHSWAPNKEICANCHEKKWTSVQAVPNKPHSCLGCHEPHSPKPGKEACAQCHGDKIKSVMAAPEKHHDCLSCHQAHEGKPQAQLICGESCHKEQQAKLRDGQAKHRDCVNCHNPHAAPKVGAPMACQKCHGEKVKAFQGSKHEVCIKCHTKHEFNGPTALARCGSCHEQAVAPNATHQDKCVRCHTPHLPGKGPAAKCSNCHLQIEPKISKHQECRNCHKPHLPAVTASQQCGGCHTDKAAVAAAWPATSPHSPGHCAQCHTKHDERQKVLCQSCHKDKPNPKHMGVHKECKGCHTPHMAPPKESDGSWWTRCGNCHKKEAAMAATGNPKHQLCANCHNNPGREPKLCLTCHTQIRQSGEHAQAKHDKCTNCHDTHGTSPPVRKACESCHKDRRTHFPDAPKCQACHPFGKE